MIGQQLGDYVIHKLLGEGAMGKVYLADHVTSRLQVAIKVIAPHFAQHGKVAQRFAAEARAAMRIDHPNVIRIYDYGELEDGTLFQVMEALDGIDLYQLLRKRRKLSAVEVLPYVQQICIGLQAAHDRGVVHRDLKPENIFILRGEPLTLKVLDFGIAKMLDPDEWVTLTATGAIVGTPMFIAPEQAIANKELIGPQTDLYSLGVILYAMLCGEPPFSEGGVGVLLTCHVKDPPPPLREKAPEVNDAVARLIHKCLEKEPDRRPASALHLAADFAAAVEAEAPVQVEHQHPRAPVGHGVQLSQDTIEDTAPHFAPGTGPGLAFELNSGADTRDTVVDLGDRDTLNLEQGEIETVIKPRSQPSAARGTTADDVRVRAASLSQRGGQGSTKAPVLIPGTKVTMSRKAAGRLAIILGGVGILLIVLLLAFAVYLLSAPAV